MIVAYSSEPYPSRVASQISFLFHSVNVFQDRHRVGSVPAARASLSPIAASLDDSDRTLWPLYRLPRLLAPTRGSAPGAGPNTQPSGAPAGAVPRGCVVPVLRPITHSQHTSARAANATCSSPSSAIGTARHDASGPLAPLPTRHAQSSSLPGYVTWLRHLVTSVTSVTSLPGYVGYVTLSRRRRNPHRSSRELLPERQVQSI